MNDLTTETPDSPERSSETRTNSQDSDGNKNTDTGNQGLFDKGVDVGFARGAKKATKEMIQSLGVNNVEELKEILDSHKERKESEKSTEQKLAELNTSFEEMKSNYSQLQNQLETYVERDRTKAQELYENLSEEDKAAFDAMSVPLETAMPVLQRLANQTPSKKTVGNPVSPAPSEVSETLTKGHDELMRDYRKRGISAVREIAEEIVSSEN